MTGVFYGQLRHEEILGMRVLVFAYGWPVADELLEVSGLAAVMAVQNGYASAGDLSRLDTLRVRARLRYLRHAGGERLDGSGSHLLEPLFDALERAEAAAGGERPAPWEGEDFEVEARRDLIAVLEGVLHRWGVDVFAEGALSELCAAIGEPVATRPRATSASVAPVASKVAP